MSDINFEDDDFVINRDTNGNIIGGGYKINTSYFSQHGTPAMTTYNEYEQTGGKVSSPFENLAVPAGLFYVNMRIPKNYSSAIEDKYTTHQTASDDLIDNLYALVEIDKKKKRKTRKHYNNTIKSNKYKTRKQK